MPGFIQRAAVLIAATVACASAVAADLPITAVPPLTNRTAPKAAEAKLLLNDGAARRIELAAPSDAELAAFRSQNAAQKGFSASQGVTKAKRLAIGFARDVPQESRVIDLAALDWQVAGGMKAARIEVQSTGASATQVALRLAGNVPGLVLRFAGTGPNARTFGPYSAAEVMQSVQQFGVFRSPVLDGSVAVIEVAVPPEASLAGASLVVPQVSHGMVPVAELGAPSAKRLQDIGDALPCEIDVKCVTPQTPALTAAASAVAKITFNSTSGDLYLCTGQVLNDAAGDGIPYFFTANHCIDNAYSAATINTYWFFDAAACGSNTPRADWVQVAGGSKLLARSPDWDWALVQLYTIPPLGVQFAAWRAEPIPVGADLTVFHHPQGDLKKYSTGTANGYVADGLYTLPTPASFLYMTYTQGETEGGSSGSGLLTFNGTGGYYEVRGGLYNGLNAACPRPAGYFDVYSRLDNMLPVVREYLTPGNNPAGTVTAVEFYNATLDHYFISTSPQEIHDLDTGVHPGWVRTGVRFNAYATKVAGTSPVCRFYRAPAYGDSHFYSASPAECAATAAAHPVDWIYESPAVFYIALPDPVAGTCPVNTRPLWRFFNQITTNHRYTPEVKLRDEMRDDPTWLPEGYGPDAVIMCSPNGA